MPHIVVGTAGHIDHGKSALVLALTGTDPDRLKEEKARGITIDLGFAHWEAPNLGVAFVDVPGHERFIKNMLAGVGGIDAVLLVVAADESVMPQTREHFDICRCSGPPASSCDHAIWSVPTCSACRLEVREVVRGSFASAPRSFTKTGEGLATLKDDSRRCEGDGATSKDRSGCQSTVFSVKGFGTW